MPSSSDSPKEQLSRRKRRLTALGGFYRRIRSRSGAPIAITATAHKLARIFYHLWTTGEDFVDAGVAAYEQQYQQRIVKHLKQRVKQMGFDLVPEILVGGVS